MRIGEHVEQARYVGSLPEQTWLGWLLYLMSAHLSVHRRHSRSRDRPHARAAVSQAALPADSRQQPRNRDEGPPARPRPAGPGGRGRRAERRAGTDRRRHLPRLQTTSRSANRPATPRRSLEVLDAIGRELSAANEAHLHPGVAAQREVLSSSLPDRVDTAAPHAQVRLGERGRHDPTRGRPLRFARRESRSATRRSGARWSASTCSTRRTATTCSSSRGRAGSARR